MVAQTEEALTVTVRIFVPETVVPAAPNTSDRSLRPVADNGPMVGQRGVLLLPDATTGADVHGGGRQLGNLVEEPMMGVDRDGVRLDHAERGIHDDADLSEDAVSDPAQANVLNRRHTRRSPERPLDG